jgi:hypothetical protein
LNAYEIPLYPPFSKGETLISSLFKREGGRDFEMAEQLPHQRPVIRGQYGKKNTEKTSF